MKKSIKSFITGIGSVMNIAGNYYDTTQYRYKNIKVMSDTEAFEYDMKVIQSDWEAIGQDFKKVLQDNPPGSFTK